MTLGTRRLKKYTILKRKRLFRMRITDETDPSAPPTVVAAPPAPPLSPSPFAPMVPYAHMYQPPAPPSPFSLAVAYVYRTVVVVVGVCLLTYFGLVFYYYTIVYSKFTRDYEEIGNLIRSKHCQDIPDSAAYNGFHETCLLNKNHIDVPIPKRVLDTIFADLSGLIAYVHAHQPFSREYSQVYIAGITFLTILAIYRVTIYAVKLNSKPQRMAVPMMAPFAYDCSYTSPYAPFAPQAAHKRIAMTTTYGTGARAPTDLRDEPAHR